jgi:metal-responsive CopG/Arc/MetJ family transcriptional regulator
MPRRRVEIEPTLLSEVERIGRSEGVSVSQIVNEALAIALAERRHRVEMRLGIGLPRPIPAGSRRLDRNEILSVLDF